MTQVIVRDCAMFEKKCAQLRRERLHIVADFDKTLTHARYNGEQYHSTIALVRDGNYLSPEYVARSKALFAQYHPVEKDPSIPMPQKVAAMHEWWARHWELMVRSGMSREVIDDIVGRDVLHARKGLSEMVGMLGVAGVPMLVLSAGMGDIITGFLRRNGLDCSGLTVVSNFFTFDDAGRANGYSEPLIHSFNKDETQVNLDYLSSRDQVLLLGDSLGDLGMTAKTRHALELRVGFANDAADEGVFAQHFDLVVMGDGPLDPVLAVLRRILK